jgi:enamine deaminase RidA (YjgF/YER057c/UK114 family)
MLKALSPRSIAPPFSRYAHAVEAAAGTRLLFVSGQVGILPDGRMCESEEEQHSQAWHNVLAVLAEAGMGPKDIIEVTVYITSRSGIPLFRAARDKALEGREVATTLLVVAGLAGVDWKVEIAAIAGKSG